jgi:hypothetical protein
VKQHRVEAYYRREHAEKKQLIETPEDVDALIDDLLESPPSQNLAVLHSLDRPILPSGFPDHELMVGANKDLQVGVLEFMDETGNFVTFSESEGRGEVPYCCDGNITEFPDHSEIPIDRVRQAAKEFLVSGGQRPTCVEWQVPDFW